MSDEKSYKRVYTGSETNIQYLQELFEEAGIPSRVRNDFESGRLAGFGATPNQAQLFVLEKDKDEALKIAMMTFPKDFSNE